MTFAETLNKCKYQLIVIPFLLAGVYYSVVSRMVSQWSNDANYSHGFIVPLIALYIIWQKYDELKVLRVEPSNLGFAVITVGLLMLVGGYLGTEYLTMRSSLIVVIAGIVISLFGTGVFKFLLLPIAFLFFMIPLPEIVYNAIAFPLKLFVAKYSVMFLDSVGIIVLREGNIIMFPNVTLEVADACSGLRSLMSLITLSVTFSVFIKTTRFRKLIIMLSAIPIAIFTNAIRVIATGALAQHYGAAVAEGFFHEFAGLLVFGVAVVLLLLTGMVLRKKEKASDDKE